MPDDRLIAGRGGQRPKRFDARAPWPGGRGTLGRRGIRLGVIENDLALDEIGVCESLLCFLSFSPLLSVRARFRQEIAKTFTLKFQDALKSCTLKLPPFSTMRTSRFYLRAHPRPLPTVGSAAGATGDLRRCKTRRSRRSASTHCELWAYQWFFVRFCAFTLKS